MIRFYIQKARHFAKSKTICDTLLYTKTRHFCVTRFFIEFLKFAEEGVSIGLKLVNNEVVANLIVIDKEPGEKDKYP